MAMSHTARWQRTFDYEPKSDSFLKIVAKNPHKLKAAPGWPLNQRHSR